MSNLSEIRKKAALVKNATKEGENTAERVGSVLVDLCDEVGVLSDDLGTSSDNTTTELANKVDKSSITQELGNSQSLLPSQKVVTDYLNTKVSKSDFASEKERVNTEIAKKANSVDVSTELAKKLPSTDFTAEKQRVNTELGKKVNNTDFLTEKQRVNAELDKKANQDEVTTELSRKVSSTDFNEEKQRVDVELSKKADSDTMISELAKKVSIDDFNTEKERVDGELDKKANSANVTSSLSKKADVEAMNTELAKKADKESVNTELAKKVNITDFEDEKNRVNDELAKKANNDDVSSKFDSQNERLTKVESAIGDIGLPTAIYYIASQNTDQSSPNLTNVQTNRSVAMLEDQYRPFLIDHTENTGDVMPADELMRNNWLRYVDGRFAPAVGITEEMRAMCDVELYLDAAHTQKYCGAGEFNAEAFYNEHGMTQKLYNAEGVEIEHILRPWETTSKNYSIKIGDPSDTWLLDDYSPTDGLMYKGILKSFREVAGLKPKKLAPTLLSPTCDTSLKDSDGKIKFRSFFFLYNVGDTNTQGGQNSTYKIPMFMEKGAYPRVNDVHQINSMTYARNNNADSTKSYPFAEMGFHAYNTFLVAKELQYGTNYINDPDNLFSSGTSSDDACSNEAQWRKYCGVRFKMGDDGAWSYVTWGNGSPNVYKDANGGKIGTHMSEFLNYQYPKWMCNEAQIVLSFAAELGIPEDTEFEVYGLTYKYVTPPRAKGLSDGYMNAIVYRQVDGDWQGYTAAGDSTTYHFEAMLRQGVMDGMVTSGDIFHYRGGGFEMVSEVVKDWNEDRQNYPTDIYLEVDQKKFHSNRTYTIASGGGRFDFEKTYEHLAHIEQTKVGWLKKRVGYTPHNLTVGGDRNTYGCAYNDNSNYWNNVIGTLCRRACRIGGHANWSACASRFMNAYNAVSYATRAYGGSAQCLFSKRS